MFAQHNFTTELLSMMAKAIFAMIQWCKHSFLHTESFPLFHRSYIKHVAQVYFLRVCASIIVVIRNRLAASLAKLNVAFRICHTIFLSLLLTISAPLHNCSTYRYMTFIFNCFARLEALKNAFRSIFRKLVWKLLRVASFLYLWWLFLQYTLVARSARWTGLFISF